MATNGLSGFWKKQDFYNVIRNKTMEVSSQYCTVFLENFELQQKVVFALGIKHRYKSYKMYEVGHKCCPIKTWWANLFFFYFSEIPKNFDLAPLVIDLKHNNLTQYSYFISQHDSFCIASMKNLPQLREYGHKIYVKYI